MANNNVELTPEELQAFMDAGPAQGTATPTEQIPSTPVAGQELSEAELKAFMDAGPAQPQQEQVAYNPIPEGWTKEQYDAAQKNLRTPDTEGKSYWELLKEAIPQAADDLGNIAKYNAARAAASVNAGIANIAEAFGGDSEFTRANQAYFQDAAKNAKGELAYTYGEGIGRDLMLETGNLLNILPFGAGRAGLAALGAVVGADTAMNIATEGDRSGINMDDVGKVTTAGLMGIAGGKVIDTAGKALAKKISGDMSEVPFEDLLTKGSEELKNIRSGSVKPTAKNTRAMQELAKRSEGNPEIAKAIEELDVSIPMDYVATGKVGAKLADQANAGRSVIGSDASLQMKNTIDEVKVKFDDWMQKNGQRDVSAISGEVKDELNKQIDEITTKTSDLYQSIESKIPDGEILESPKTLELLNKYIKSAGGEIKYLPKPLQELYEVLGRGTLDTLKEERSLIGAATSKLNSNKYKNVSSKKITDLYDAMKKDQRYNLEKYAPELKDSLEDADKMYVELKSLEDKLKVGFGKEGTGSLVNKLSNALNSGKKGDITNLTKYIDVIIPENKRAEALLSSIHELSQKSGEFNFSNFNKIWGNLSKHKETRELLVKSMGEDMVNKLDQWDKITFAMEKSLKSIRGNRNLNKHIINQKMDNDVIGGMLRKVIEGTSSSFGMPISLNKIMKSPLWKLEELNKLVDSPEFKKIMLDTINGRNIEKVSPFKKKLTQLLGNIFVKEGAQKAADKKTKDFVPNEGFKKVNWFSDRIDKPEGLNSLTANPKGKNVVKVNEPIEGEIVEPEAQKLIGNNKGDQKLIGNNKKGQALIGNKKSGQATIENKRSGQKLLENIAKPEGPKDGLDTLVKPKPKKAPKKKVEPKKEPKVDKDEEIIPGKYNSKIDYETRKRHGFVKIYKDMSKDRKSILRKAKIKAKDYDNSNDIYLSDEELLDKYKNYSKSLKEDNYWVDIARRNSEYALKEHNELVRRYKSMNIEELGKALWDWEDTASSFKNEDKWPSVAKNWQKMESKRRKETKEWLTKEFYKKAKETEKKIVENDNVKITKRPNVKAGNNGVSDEYSLYYKNGEVRRFNVTDADKNFITPGKLSIHTGKLKNKDDSYLDLSHEEATKYLKNIEKIPVEIFDTLTAKEVAGMDQFKLKALQNKGKKEAKNAKTDTSVLNFTPKDKGLDSLTKQTQTKNTVEIKGHKDFDEIADKLRGEIREKKLSSRKLLSNMSKEFVKSNFDKKYARGNDIKLDNKMDVLEEEIDRLDKKLNKFYKSVYSKEELIKGSGLDLFKVKALKLDTKEQILDHIIKENIELKNLPSVQEKLDELEIKQTESKNTVELKDKKNNTGYNEDMKKEAKTNTSALDSLNKKSDPNITSMIVPDNKNTEKGLDSLTKKIQSKDTEKEINTIKDTDIAEINGLKSAISSLDLNDFEKKILKAAKKKTDIENFIGKVIKKQDEDSIESLLFDNRLNSRSLEVIIDNLESPKDIYLLNLVAGHKNINKSLLEKMILEGKDSYAATKNILDYEDIDPKIFKKLHEELSMDHDNIIDMINHPEVPEDIITDIIKNDGMGAEEAMSAYAKNNNIKTIPPRDWNNAISGSLHLAYKEEMKNLIASKSKEMRKMFKGRLKDIAKRYKEEVGD